MSDARLDRLIRKLIEKRVLTYDDLNELYADASEEGLRWIYQGAVNDWPEDLTSDELTEGTWTAPLNLLALIREDHPRVHEPTVNGLVDALSSGTAASAKHRRLIKHADLLVSKGLITFKSLTLTTATNEDEDVDAEFQLDRQVLG